MENHNDTQMRKKDNFRLAITSLVLGILGLLAWLSPICGVLIPVLGLIFGIISINSSKRGMAIAGIVLSVIGLILFVVSSVIAALVAYGLHLYQ